MTLTPELVAYCRENIDFKSYFEPSDVVIAHHELFNQWVVKSGYHKIPKPLFYIIMDEEYGPAYEAIDNKGNLGRKLKLK